MTFRVQNKNSISNSHNWVVQSAGSEEYDIECRPCCLTGWRGEAVLATLHVWWFILIFLLAGPAPAPASTMAGHDGTDGGRHSHTVWLSDTVWHCLTLSDCLTGQSDRVTRVLLTTVCQSRAVAGLCWRSRLCSQSAAVRLLAVTLWTSDSDRHSVTPHTQTVTDTLWHFSLKQWQSLRVTSHTDTERHSVAPQTQTPTDTPWHLTTPVRHWQTLTDTTWQSSPPSSPAILAVSDWHSSQLRSDELDKLLDSPQSCTEGQWLPLLTTENIIISQPAVLPVMNIICQLLQWLSANVATFQILLIVRTGQRRPAMTIVGHNYSYVFNFEQVSSNIFLGSLWICQSMNFALKICPGVTQLEFHA